MVFIYSVWLKFSSKMKVINLVLAAEAVAVNSLICFTRILADFPIIFMVTVLLNIAIMAIDSRSLNYLYYNPKMYGKQIVIVADFVLKAIVSILLVVFYFINSLAVFAVVNALAVIEGCLFFVEIKWFKDNLVFASPPQTKEMHVNMQNILITYIAYLISACTIYFPDFNQSLNWLWFIVVDAGVIVYVIDMRKLVNGKLRKIIYFALMLLSLSWFLVIKYCFDVDSPISIFFFIGLLLMLPYYIYISKLIRNNTK